MKRKSFRTLLALLLVISLFVSFGAMTAFAYNAQPDPAAAKPKHDGFDPMVLIGMIKILKQSFDPNGGTLAGASIPFEREVAKGVKYFIPAAPVKEGDPFVCWQNANGEQFQPWDRVADEEDMTYTAIYESDLIDIDPALAAMLLELRG